ncbi:MAG: 2-dehydropantoate 2-reductase [Pseudomonadota bacterium]|nr:2-dehydropantoate 2-reductase [Pseudomonadota bacterium]
MKVCIFGAGAIGGYIGGLLARRGEAEVSLIARGAHLAAIAARGLTLRMSGEEFTVKPAASDDPRKFGPQDVVILTLKAHAIAATIPLLESLLGPDTAILYGQNGIPWWYFYRHGGAYDNRRLDSVDPGGAIWNALHPERAVGAVIWQAAELEAPGIVVHAFGGRMPIAEPSGERTARVEALSGLLNRAGVKCPVKSDLRPEIWMKLLGNLSFNPVSVLTGGTLAGMAEDPHARAVVRTMMQEARAVAGILGISFAVSIDERIAMAARVGAHRTSMLQDTQSGRPTELDAVLGSVIELGAMTGTPTPALSLVYDLVRAHERTAASH